MHRIPPFYRRQAIVAGPLVLLARDYAGQSRSDFRAVPGRPGRYYAQKLLVVVRARQVVTVSVPRTEQGLALLYGRADSRIPYARGYRLADGERRVTFHACRENEPSFVPRSRKTVGRWTEFNGAVVVAGARCVTLRARVPGRARVFRVRVSFGVGRCR